MSTTLAIEIIVRLRKERFFNQCKKKIFKVKLLSLASFFLIYVPCRVLQNFEPHTLKVL